MLKCSTKYDLILYFLFDCWLILWVQSQVRDRATLYLEMLGGDGEIVETQKDVKLSLIHI